MNLFYKCCLIIVSSYLLILKPSCLIFLVLIVVNITDYITGILNSIQNGSNFSPIKSIKGIIKKLNILFFVIVAITIDILISHQFKIVNGSSLTTTPVILWLIMNEILSICSNISNNSNIIVPPMLEKILLKFKEET